VTTTNEHIKTHGVSMFTSETAHQIFRELTGDEQRYDLTLLDDPAMDTHSTLDWLLRKIIACEKQAVERALAQTK